MKKNNKIKKLSIIGGGPAGLASAYFANNKGLKFELFEGNSEVGGNCKTIEYKNFKFDLGAHRFHDKNEYVTSLIKNLLNDDLKLVTTPSKIFYKGKMITFPIEFRNLLKKLDSKIILKILIENGKNIFNQNNINNFNDLVIKKYGSTISELFINNYSKKLWGKDTTLLSPKISGGRLKNLNIMSIIKIFSGRKHFEGFFYYPKDGFGMIFDKIKEEIQTNNIFLNSKITKIFHHNNKINALELNNTKKIEVDKLINSLPINFTANILEPKIPSKILDIVKTLRFRNLRIVVIFLQMKNFSNYASIYFPDKNVNFTRIYEPKQRSNSLAPNDKTCIVVEVPCNESDELYNSHSDIFKNEIINSLLKMNLIQKNKIIESLTYKIPNAYPILTNDNVESMKIINDYIKKFENMKMIGRGAEFKYLHTHDIFAKAVNYINFLSQE